MQIKIKSILRSCFSILLGLVVLSTSSCTKAESPESSCKYLIELLGNEDKRHDIENWLTGIFERPQEWQEAEGKPFRGMGTIYISVPDKSRLEEMGLPENIQLIASKGKDGSIWQVTAAVAQWIGIIYSKDKRIIDAGTIPERRGERIGILCLSRD